MQKQLDPQAWLKESHSHGVNLALKELMYYKAKAQLLELAPKVKIKNSLSNINEGASLILQSNSDIEKTIVDLNSQIKLVEYVIDYVIECFYKNVLNFYISDFFIVFACIYIIIFGKSLEIFYCCRVSF